MERLRRRYHLVPISFLFTGLLLVLVLSPAHAQVSQSVNLTLTEFKITPDEISVPAGTPVQFIVQNAGTTEHNLVVELEDENIEQKLFASNLMPGETRTAEFTFTMDGEWEMYCPVGDHKEHGMTGEVRVGSATPGMPKSGDPTALEAMLLALTGAGLALLFGGLLMRRMPSQRV